MRGENQTADNKHLTNKGIQSRFYNLVCTQFWAIGLQNTCNASDTK